MDYRPFGVCSQLIRVEVEDNIVKSAEFVGGCSGNTQGVARLVKGMNVDEAADLLETYVGKMNGVFTVGDLKYLSRTGRIKGSVAVVGNMLKIKPILRGSEDGYIVSYKNVRGRKAVLNELIRLFCETIEEPEKQIVGIAHADAYEESLYMMEEIQKRVKVREFINTSYDYCTGSHVGPDTIALFYLGKDRSLL